MSNKYTRNFEGQIQDIICGQIPAEQSTHKDRQMAENRWTVDWNILVQVHQKVDKSLYRSDGLLGLVEVEQVILALIELNYLKLEDKEN